MVFTEADLLAIGNGNPVEARREILDFVYELRRRNKRAEAEGSKSSLDLVRLAVPEDRPALFAMCHDLHGENGLFALDDEKLNQMLDRAFNKEGAIIGVIGEVGAPVASIYLELSQFGYTKEWSLVEQWAFVDPEHRRNNYAQELISFAKRSSDGLGVPLLAGILSNKRTEAKVRFYDRMMQRIGGYYIHNPHLAHGAWG